MGSGALAFAGPVTATARAVGVEDVDLHTVGTSWRITGTAGPESLDAFFSRGTRFDALGGDDTFQGSPFADEFLGGPGTDTRPAWARATTPVCPWRTRTAARASAPDLRAGQPATWASQS